MLGQIFTPQALAAVSGQSPAELEPRLRALVRRELLELEADPRSPERGQYRFVQSLIREVAYGTLARRDRRARHLAGRAGTSRPRATTSWPACLASHYLAAHEASDDGPEADAVAAQARLALSRRGRRAASLASPDQAVLLSGAGAVGHQRSAGSRSTPRPGGSLCRVRSSTGCRALRSGSRGGLSRDR